MATNTYTYGSLGERWVLQTPTSKANLDIARTKNDANRWTLEALLDDPDDSPFVLANVTTVTVTGPVATAGLLNLWTAETTVVDTDILGRIDFKAPDQTGDGDGVLVTASIYAEADATFSATVNETDIVFATAHDGAAAERLRITSQGEIGLAGANYGTDGYVITSTGAGTAVAWEAIPSPEVSAVLQRTVATGLDITAKTAENASKIILVDLTDPATMWDVEAFLAATRFTSWRVELGAPPMRGAIFLNEAGTELHWWNLDTDAAYMQFDGGGSGNDDANMIYMSSIKPSCIAFLDGKIYFGVSDGGGGGAWVIDFLRDDCIGWFTSGQRRYTGNIEERNDGKGNDGTRTTLQIENNTVISIAAGRTASTVDSFGRPVHFWAVGSSVGLSFYNPTDDAIYDSADGQDAYGLVALPDTSVWATQQHDPADPDAIIYYATVFQATADSFSKTNNYGQDTALSSGSLSLNFFSSSWFPVMLAAYRGGVTGGDVLLAATNEGMLFLYQNEVTPSESGLIHVTTTYQTPYMKGPRGGVYPLNDLNDRSGAGLNLTNTGSTPTATGPFGANTAYDFDGSGMMLQTAHSVAQLGTNKLTVSCWFNPDAASGEEALVCKIGGTNYPNLHDWMLTVFGADMRFQIYNGNTAYTATGYPLATGEWYHACGVYDGAYVRLYVNGVEATTKAALTGNMDTDNVAMTIGAEANNSHNFNGKISQVSIQMSAWTEAEVNMEYQRMLRALSGAKGTLANADVKSVRVDQNTGLAAVTTAANQVEIWNAELGLRESINATTTATLNDADVRLPEGADEPLLAMGRSGQIDVVAPDRRILG